MRGISGDINATHPRSDEVIVSLALVGDWHEVSEGIMVKGSPLNTVKDS